MHFISAVTAAAALFAAGSFAAPHRPGFGGHPEFGGRPSLGDRTQFTRPPLQTLTTIECKCATTSLVEPTTTAEPIVDGTTSSATTTGAINTASSFIPGPTPSFEACMTDNEASEVAEVFRQIIQGYTIEMAMAALTEDFVDYTSAVSIIVNKGGSAPKDLLVPIFTNRTQFMAGHGTQKGIPFETLNVWHDCNGTVSMRWWTSRSGQGQPTESAAIPVVGIAVLETELAESNNPLGYKYRIHTLYSEFNTAAWLVNNGVFTPGPNVTVTPVPAKRDIEALRFDKRTSVHEAREANDGLKALG